MKYEAHITVEPDEGLTTYEKFVEWAASDPVHWKASKFDHDDVDGIAGKWFLSYASDDRNLIVAELKGMAHGLAASGFDVLRAKLEETLFDTKDGQQLDDFV